MDYTGRRVHRLSLTTSNPLTLESVQVVVPPKDIVPGHVQSLTATLRPRLVFATVPQSAQQPLSWGRVSKLRPKPARGLLGVAR